MVILIVASLFDGSQLFRENLLFAKIYFSYIGFLTLINLINPLMPHYQLSRLNNCISCSVISCFVLLVKVCIFYCKCYKCLLTAVSY